MKTYAIILAAGKGTRFGESEINKTAVLVNGKPLIRIGIEKIYRKFSEIIVVVGVKKESVITALKGLPVKFVDQNEQNGTGHAVKVAIDHISKFEKTPDSVFVANGDHLFMIEDDVIDNLIESHLKSQNDVTVLTTYHDSPQELTNGRIVNSNGHFVKIVEKKDLSTEYENIKELNTGTYVFKYGYLESYLGCNNNKNEGEIYITDACNSSLAKVETYPVSYEKVGSGVNTREELLKASFDINKTGAIILAAGKGTRMNAPKHKNKVTFKVNGKALIRHTYQTIKEMGINNVVVVVGHAKESVMKVLKKNVTYVEQVNQLGTGNAAKCGLTKLSPEIEHVFIMSGDDSAFYTKDLLTSMLKSHISSNSDLTLLTLDKNDPSGLGRVIRDSNGHISKIIEEKNTTESQKRITEINSGLYCFSRKFLDKNLSEIRENIIAKEYYLTDLVDIAYQRGSRINGFKWGDDSVWFGVNTIEQLKEANKIKRKNGIFLRFLKLLDDHNINVSIAFVFAIYLVWVIKLITIREMDNGVFFGLYSIFVSTYIMTRFLLAYHYDPNFPHLEEDYEPSIAFAIPAYNEGENIRETILRISQTNYPKDKFEIIVVNDCSTDNTLSEIEMARSIATDNGVKVKIIDLPENRGKREGMAECVQHSTSEIVIFIDSDSFVDQNTARELVKYFVDKKVAAVAGHANVANADENVITKMQAVRYFVAFKAYKAAEALHGSVTCCSGCCSAYRREYMNQVLDRWRNQSFMGVRCTYGDDRSLTNFLLKEGYTALYSPTAIAYTFVPNTFRKFMKQQFRWKKSWVRESLIASTFIWRRNPIMSISYYIGIILPLLAPIIVLRAIVWYPLTTDRFPYYYLFGLTLMAIVYGLYYRIYVKDNKWIYGVLFASFYTLVLIWQLPWAVLNLRDSKWGTR